MRLRYFFFSGFLLLGLQGWAQKEKPSALMDTAILDYDEIFSELDALLDSLYTPRSFFVAAAGAGKGFFQYNTTSGDSTSTKAELLLTPSLGYFHKSGFGAGAGASLLPAGSSGQPWQYSLTGSYDYLKKRAFITGLSLTHYFIKKDLPFYTSPLQNEAYGYFTYRRHWLKPSVNASYGWGSRSDVEQQTAVIKKMKKNKGRGRNGSGNNGGGNGNSGTTTTTTITSYEKIIDFNLQVSVRHDFYFLHLLSKKDYVRLTPQLAFSAGSQQFGFNSVTNTTFAGKRNGSSGVATTQNITLDDKLQFRPLSLTTLLRTEYACGKFFVQPQLVVDYYFPAQTNPFTTTFFVNAGFVF